MATAARNSGHELRAGTLGVGAVTFFVVSAAGPLVAIAAGVPVAMLLGNGAGIPAMFVIAVCILLTFAAGYTAMAHHVRSTGGFYVFAARGLGGHAAGGTAAIALFSYTSIQIGLYGLFGSAASDFIRAHAGIQLPWWLCACAAMLVAAVLGYRQVDLSARVLATLVICEYLVVFVLDIAVLTGGSAEISAAAFMPAAIERGSPAIGLLMCFAAFIGFEATTIYAEEARNPARTIPIATYLSLLLIGGFYVFSSWCLVAAVGHARLSAALSVLHDPTTFVFQIADERAGMALATAMRLLLLTSAFAAILAFHNSISRYLFAMGREGLLPERLSRTHLLHLSPHVASVTQSLSAWVIMMLFVVAGADPITVLFARVSAVGTLGVVALMAIASAAVLGYFRGQSGNWLRVRAPSLVSTVSLLCVFTFGCVRFDVLAGGFSPLVEWLPVLLLATAAVGVLMADALRRRDADHFRTLGRTAP